MSADGAGRVAIERFEAGYNCAESVLQAIASIHDLRVADAQRLATAFGAGIARRGSVCGCLTGAAIAVGALRGRTSADDTAARDACYGAMKRVLAAVQARFGAIDCRTLTGIDFDSAERDEQLERRVHDDVCVPLLALVTAETLAAVEAG